ncbi:MAG TPA: hypothetical protein VGV87_05360 [Blastocatellia bacterium]|nr:hypothetical protein [Blastocatellia bacterium]
MNCTRIKRIIDEADRPDVFPLEAAGHVAGCPDCRSFADERARLRELTGSVARVTAPGNFNALLNERLSRVKSQRSSWLSPAGFMRLGTATAGLLVVFIALQYGGFLSTKTPTTEDQHPPVAGGELRGDGSSSPATPAPPVVRLPDHTPRSLPRAINVATSRTPKATRQDGPPLLLVRDNNGDRTLLMIPVSVGMQQQVQNGSYGRQPRSSDISY